MTNMTVEEQIAVCDPVKVAVRLFNGTERNRLLWGWYCRTMGRDRFREYVYQKYCENKEAGMPRNPAAAFQAMLNRALPKRQSAAPAAPQTKSAAMMADPFQAVVKSFSRCSAPRSEEQRQRDWERNKEIQLRQLAEWQSQQPS